MGSIVSATTDPSRQAITLGVSARPVTPSFGQTPSGVGNDVDALAFAPGNRGYGPNLFYYLRRDITGLRVTAPDGGPPHSLAQQGYYMMFALSRDDVPSVAKWVYLH